MYDIATRLRVAHGRLALRFAPRSYRLFVSDKTTALIERDRLSDLVLATTQPEVSAHAIPRLLLTAREESRSFELDPENGSVSPLAVLIVLGMLLAVFVAIVQI
jgi:hypothetical protein